MSKQILRYQNSSQVDETIRNYCVDVIQKIGIERNKDIKWAKLEGFVRIKELKIS